MKIKFGKYYDQFQVGVLLCIHKHGEKRHGHMWFDLGKYYLQLDVGFVD